MFPKHKWIVACSCLLVIAGFVPLARCQNQPSNHQTIELHDKIGCVDDKAFFTATAGNSNRWHVVCINLDTFEVQLTDKLKELTELPYGGEYLEYVDLESKTMITTLFGCCSEGTYSYCDFKGNELWVASSSRDEQAEINTQLRMYRISTADGWSYHHFQDSQPIDIPSKYWNAFFENQAAKSKNWFVADNKKNELEFVLRNKVAFYVEKQGKTINGFIATNDSLILSEETGFLRCFDKSTQQLRFEFNSEWDWFFFHELKNGDIFALRAILDSVRENIDSIQYVLIDRKSGKVQILKAFEKNEKPWSIDCLNSTHCLVNKNEIRTLPELELVRTLQAPTEN